VADFQPCGVITLTTDFGHKGPFVAVMKGVMLGRFPEARIVDLTHETDVHFPAEAGFWLSRSYRYFPAGTVHVAVVDPGVGTQRDIVVLACDGHAFVAPDNGLLAPIADRPGAAAYRLALDRVPGLDPSRVSATFHGRDIFAPIGAELAAGRIAPSGLGPRAEAVVPSWIEEPRVAGGSVHGVVVAVDHFGNLITNIDRSHLAELPSGDVVVQAAGREFTLRRTYGDVRPGDYLALINSFEVLELARAERSAAESLGLGRGAPVVATAAKEGG
jgi:S-adenosyl-L-methionine hydrolase (adenosine-forming)